MILRRLIVRFQAGDPRPEAPDYSDELPEIMMARSHDDWHRANKIPIRGDCEWCKRTGDAARAAQRAHEMGMRRTP